MIAASRKRAAIHAAFWRRKWFLLSSHDLSLDDVLFQRPHSRCLFWPAATGPTPPRSAARVSYGRAGAPAELKGRSGLGRGRGKTYTAPCL
jgi:hypothetical protein